MLSFVFVASFISAAAAQLAPGASSVPAPTITPSPTANPTSSPTPSNFYQVMPYSAYQSGGYSSLQCGYGYAKQSDGSCSPESWVRFEATSNDFGLIFLQYSSPQSYGCYATTVIK